MHISASISFSIPHFCHTSASLSYCYVTNQDGQTSQNMETFCHCLNCYFGPFKSISLVLQKYLHRCLCIYQRKVTCKKSTSQTFTQAWKCSFQTRTTVFYIMCMLPIKMFPTCRKLMPKINHSKPLKYSRFLNTLHCLSENVHQLHKQKMESSTQLFSFHSGKFLLYEIHFMENYGIPDFSFSLRKKFCGKFFCCCCCCCSFFVCVCVCVN